MTSVLATFIKQRQNKTHWTLGELLRPVYDAKHRKFRCGFKHKNDMGQSIQEWNK